MTSLEGATASDTAHTALRDEICRETARVCAVIQSQALEAIVMTGSLARDEASWTNSNGIWVSLGDAEIFLVFGEGAALPEESAIRHLETQAEEALRARGIQCPIELTPVPLSYLKNLPPAIFSYELLTCGRVIWGKENVLQLIPAFFATDIPREDAWQLLCNRMIECLEAAIPESPSRSSLQEGLAYRLIKLCLDQATSLLVFAGAYEPTYAGRTRALLKLANDRGREEEFPFALHEFAKHVERCTELKLGARTLPAGQPVPDLGALEQAVDYAHRLWRWELGRLCRVTADAMNDLDLIRERMRLQSTGQRLRGWAVVLRECGWLRSCKQWQRWAWMAGKGSPRYFVYGVASSLFFRLPDLIAGRASETVDWHGLHDCLPIHSGRLPESLEQMGAFLSGEVAFNYHHVLQKTRS